MTDSLHLLNELGLDDDKEAELQARVPGGCYVDDYCEYDNLITYAFCGDFEVDGIRYSWATNFIRPMFSIESQGANYPSRMSFSRPITDEELDHWVRTGKPLPRKG